MPPLGAPAMQMCKGCLFHAPTTSTLGLERTLDLVRQKTTKISSGKGGEREIAGWEGRRKGRREARREDRRLQLRCQRWRNRSGKERAAHIMIIWDVAAKCSRRDFTEPGEDSWH